MGRLIPLLFLATIALVAVALISCLSVEDSDVRTLPRPIWVLLIVCFPLAGAVAWFLAGRPLQTAGGPQRGRQQRRTLAPDDDPEFLRSLDVERAKRDRELFRHWENDLARQDEGQRSPDDRSASREGEGRRRKPGGTGAAGGASAAGEGAAGGTGGTSAAGGGTAGGTGGPGPDDRP